MSNNTSKFHLKCSCIHCKKEILVQNLVLHNNTHIPKKNCKQCNSPIFTITKSFCTSSCAAKYWNARKDYSSFRSGPRKGQIPSNYHPYTKVSWCVICNKAHKGTAQSCSEICYKKLLSQRQKSRVAAGWDPNKNRGRGKQSYLESSFEKWLYDHQYYNFEKEKHFRYHIINKSYYVDFYFPSLNLIIELDGTQHNRPDQKNADMIRDQFLVEHYNLNIIRISHKDYVSQTRVEEIKSLLGI